MRRRLVLPVAVLLGVTSGSPAPAGLHTSPGHREQDAQDRPLPVSRGKRLYLKDGSFQVVRDWEVRPDPTGQGRDRVRYYSVERSKYEELPAELVDFDATRKHQQDLAEREADLREDIEARRVEQLAATIDVDSSIEVAPGLFLPDDVGMWVLEPKQGGGGSNILLPLTQVNAASKVDKGRLLTQIFVPIPVIPGKHKVEIAGNRAVLRIRHLNPEFYIRTEDKREPEMELIRVKVKGDKREVEVVKTYVTGEKLEERNTVSVERWPVARGVFRLTLSQPLTPGEYVLAEILPGEGINLYVWDFGIDR